MQSGLTILGILSVLMVLISAWADRRRQRRNNLEAVGFMPWPLITILATLSALFSFALALKMGTS